MNEDPSSAFIEAPPWGIMPLSTKAILLITRALNKAGVSLEDADFIGAYLCVSRGDHNPTAAMIFQAFMDLDDERIEEITGYVARVNQRRQFAAIEVSDSGKSDG